MFGTSRCLDERQPLQYRHLVADCAIPNDRTGPRLEARLTEPVRWGWAARTIDPGSSGRPGRLRLADFLQEAIQPGVKALRLGPEGHMPLDDEGLRVRRVRLDPRQCGGDV